MSGKIRGVAFYFFRVARFNNSKMYHLFSTVILKVNIWALYSHEWITIINVPINELLMPSGHPKGQKPKNPLFMELRHPGMTYCKSYIRSIVIIHSSIPFFYQITIIISYPMIFIQLVHDLNIFQFPHWGFMNPYNLT